MRRLTIALALALPLLLAAPAAAKRVTSAKVCGPADCRTVEDHAALTALSQGGSPADPPHEGSGWYDVRITVDTGAERHETFPMVLVPGAGLLRGGDSEAGYTWMSSSRSAIREYRELTRGLVPFPAAGLPGLEAPAPPPPRETAPAAAGGSSPLPWIAGGAVLALAAAVALVRRRRATPAPRSQAA